LLAELESALDRFQVEGHSDDTGAVALRPLGAGAVRVVPEAGHVSEPGLPVP
jgi:hypothetical protein